MLTTNHQVHQLARNTDCPHQFLTLKQFLNAPLGHNCLFHLRLTDPCRYVQVIAHPSVHLHHDLDLVHHQGRRIVLRPLLLVHAPGLAQRFPQLLRQVRCERGQ